MKWVPLIGAFAVAALPAYAQESVKLQFSDGRVTLTAQNAQVRTILSEWGRLGSVTIVNGDALVGPPVTLQLTAVPERQALDVVLRSAAGYMLAPRPTGSPGASAFDRVLILPTSVAPRTPPPAAASRGVSRPPNVRTPFGVAPDLEIEAPIGQLPDDDAAEPQTTIPARVRRPVMPRGIPRPIISPQVPPVEATLPDPEQSEEDDEAAAQDPQVGVSPTPSNPFGLPFGSSATPGVVTPAPTPQRAPPNRVQ
jgi:hypothetical protein